MYRLTRFLAFTGLYLGVHINGQFYLYYDKFIHDKFITECKSSIYELLEYLKEISPNHSIPDDHQHKFIWLRIFNWFEYEDNKRIE